MLQPKESHRPTYPSPLWSVASRICCRIWKACGPPGTTWRPGISDMVNSWYLRQESSARSDSKSPDLVNSQRHIAYIWCDAIWCRPHRWNAKTWCWCHARPRTCFPVASPWAAWWKPWPPTTTRKAGTRAPHRGSWAIEMGCFTRKGMQSWECSARAVPRIVASRVSRLGAKMAGPTRTIWAVFTSNLCFSMEESGQM